MATQTGNATTGTEIRTLIEDRVAAIRARDVDRSVSHTAPGVLLFDVVNPLQHRGADGERKRLEEWFSQFEDGPIGFELRDLSIAASDEVAFCHSINHVSATTTAGQTLDMWWRATVCFRKLDGEWMITHEHSSVPFDMETGLPSLGLTPDDLPGGR